MKLSHKRKLQMLQEIIDDPSTSQGDRLKALGQWERLKKSKKKGKPRGRPFVKKRDPLQAVLEREKERRDAIPERLVPTAAEQQAAQLRLLAESKKVTETDENPQFAAPESAVPKAGDGVTPSKDLMQAPELEGILRMMRMMHQGPDHPLDQPLYQAARPAQASLNRNRICRRDDLEPGGESYMDDGMGSTKR